MFNSFRAQCLSSVFRIKQMVLIDLSHLLAMLVSCDEDEMKFAKFVRNHKGQ